MGKKENDNPKNTFQALSDENESFHQDRPFNQITEELKQAKALFDEFIESLGEGQNSSLSNTLYNYCGKYKNFFVSAEDVKNLVQKRIERMFKNRKIKRNWNDEDSKIIVWVVSKYIEREGIQQIKLLGENDWKNISACIPGSTPESCMFKILSLKKIKLSQEKWTQAQSQLLYQLVQKSQNKNWKKISFQLYKLKQDENKIFRNSKQCKEHWTCYLNPDLKKGPWTTEEDEKFLKYIVQNKGSKKWVKLSKIFSSRTENALKNRYNLIIEREKRNFPQAKTQLDIISAYLKKLESKKLQRNQNNAEINEIMKNDEVNEIYEEETPIQKHPTTIQQPDTIHSKHESNVSNEQAMNFPIMYPVMMFVYPPPPQ